MVLPLRILTEETGAVHYANSKYCQIETILPNRKWKYSFEDLDEESGQNVDWDFNEPVLWIEKIGWNRYRVAGRILETSNHVNVYFGNRLLWENLTGNLSDVDLGYVDVTYVNPLIVFLPVLFGGLALFLTKR